MNSMTTIREELDNCGFDWSTGQIIYRGFGVDRRGNPSLFADRPPPRVLAHDAPELDVEFDGSFGAMSFPPMIAYDATRIYVIRCYDGASGLAIVERDPDAYVSGKSDVPIIGGG